MLKSVNDLPMIVSIAGIDIVVKSNDDIVVEEDDTIGVGISNYPEQTIVLKTTGHGLDLINQALYHEMLHWIFYLMNEFDICQDEKVIDAAALLLHDAIKSFDSDQAK